MGLEVSDFSPNLSPNPAVILVLLLVATRIIPGRQATGVTFHQINWALYTSLLLLGVMQCGAL